MIKHKLAAVIEIGSGAVRMNVSQWNGKETVVLDRLEKPTLIGSEAFTSGYISYETVQSLTEIINGFYKVAREYGVIRVHAIATTALREASNRAFVLDHIATHSKLDVRVLEDAETSALLIETMRNTRPPAEAQLLVYGGMGTTDFAMIKNGQTAYSYSLQTGLLKISEMLREASDFSRHIERVADEYLNSCLLLNNRMTDLLKAKSFAFATSDLFELFPAKRGGTSVSARDWLELRKKHRAMSPEQIADEHGISIQQGGVLYAMIAAVAALLRLTKTKAVCVSQVTLADALLDLALRPGARRAYLNSLREGALSSATDLAGRYRSDLKHCITVEEFALILFEALKSAHGLSKQRRLLLSLACLLHEAGHFANTVDDHEASFALVKDAQIYGLRAHETLLCASIIAPRDLLRLDTNTAGRAALGFEDALFVAKMHSIFHMADSLDYSHKQKVKSLNACLGGDRFIIHARVSEDFSIEQLRFRNSAALFREIFGIAAELELTRSEGNGI